ncbi:MAG: HAD hydrolase-like protein [Candidatus Thiodiazotropha sp.]
MVIGEGPGIDFESITTGINLILKQGAQLVCTNPDHSVDAHYQGRHRVLPGGGALVAPFAIATGKQPLIVGKPQPQLNEMAAERISVNLQACLMIGDRPDTDISGAARLGSKFTIQVGSDSILIIEKSDARYYHSDSPPMGRAGRGVEITLKMESLA